MRKIITAAACLLIMAMLSLNVLAASLDMNAAADKTTISAGQSVVITVSVGELESCKSGSLKISYNESLFTRSNNEWLLSGTAIADAEGDAVFAFSTAKTVSGQIYRFTLTAKEDAKLTASDISMSLTLKTADGTTTTESDSVTITIACPHSYSNSCDTECDLCGATREISHSWDEGTITTAATCTSEGVKTCTCTVCGATKTEAVAVAGHSYDKGTVTTPAGCTTTGEKTFTCTACGATKTETVEENGHSYDDGVVSKEATCSEDGEKTVTCTVCGKVKTETIARIDHIFDNDCDTDCNVCAATREITHSFIWNGNETEHWEECSVCGYTEMQNAHECQPDMSYDDSVHGYLCTVCGLFVGGENHSFDNDCDTNCDVCGYTRVTEHNYSDRWSFNHEGHWYECTACGDQLEMELHVPGAEATETTDQTCIICGYIIEVAANHEHSMAGDWLSDEEGHWYQCICNVYTAPVAHNWDDGVLDAEKSILTYTCTDCGYIRMEEYVPETLPQETQPTEGTDPSDPTENQQPTDPGKDPDWLDFDLDFQILNFKIRLWMILAVCLVISVGFNVYLLICLFSSKKTGKYVRSAPIYEEEIPEDAPQIAEENEPANAQEVSGEDPSGTIEE